MQVDIDAELAYIIEQMRADQMTNRAIRNYAKSFIGFTQSDLEEWTKRYEQKY